MTFRLSPFDGSLSAIRNEDLANLRSVSEGWYVEYKSQAIVPKAMAKGLSAFANQYGGWMIFGIEEDSETLTAKSYPGIENSKVPEILNSLRNASKDLLNPEVYYQTRVFEGPIEEVALAAGRSLIVVRIPAGAEPPYVHSDGRIYRRVADSSDPKPETDQSRLDRLSDRAQATRSRIEAFVRRRPKTAQSESDNSYLNVSIFSDPYEILGHGYSGKFGDFVSAMKNDPLDGVSIPFDNFFSQPGGFVARQTVDNDPHFRIPTWEFGTNGHSFVTIPLNKYFSSYFQKLDGYPLGGTYARLLEKNRITRTGVLDLNLIFAMLHAVVFQHRKLAQQMKVDGPFYVKCHIDNVWRTTPFLDMSSFVEHVRDFGPPIIQFERELSPIGTGLDTFIQLPEKSTLSHDAMLEDAVAVVIPLFHSLGVPTECLESGSHELAQLGHKFLSAQKLRNSKRT